MECKKCKALCIKAGRQKDGTQKYQCKGCKKYQQAAYKNLACQEHIMKAITKLLIEGVGINSIARILNISVSTVINKIKLKARLITKPLTMLANRIYEMDELWTFVGNKKNEIWISYMIDRVNKQVVDYKVGARTKENLKAITDQVLCMNPTKICTNGLNIYKTLVPASLHQVGLPNTRHIERFNLNLRTHLKRLSRKTICFSKSKIMLEACLKIYFWSKERNDLSLVCAR